MTPGSVGRKNRERNSEGHVTRAYSLNPRAAAFVEAFAANQGVTKSAVVNKAIEDYEERVGTGAFLRTFIKEADNEQ